MRHRITTASVPKKDTDVRYSIQELPVDSIRMGYGIKLQEISPCKRRSSKATRAFPRSANLRAEDTIPAPGRTLPAFLRGQHSI